MPTNVNNNDDVPINFDIGQITDKATILCPYHKSEFCFKSGEVKKWIGKKNVL